MTRQGSAVLPAREHVRPAHRATRATNVESLRIVRGPGAGRETPLGAECWIGRAPGSGLRLDDATVSRLHARITRREGAYVLEDLHSRNGTSVNARPIQRATLVDGDLVGVGRVALVFRAR